MAPEVYHDPSRSIEERVEDLLGRMSLDEKLAQLGCVWISSLMDREGFSEARAREVAPHGIGEITRISGATALRPPESAALMNRLQRYMVEGTRLGVPVLVHEEGTGGFLARDATVFPQALALAATFSPELVEEVAAAVREQMLAVGARHCLAPVLDVARDPRWGRVEETFGEDPVLAGVLGAAYVRGLQTGDLARGVLATGKHFLGHARPDGGRNHAPVHLGPRELRDVHAEPFAVAIREAGLGSVMNSYSSVDGLPPAGSRSLLTDLLRGELGFEGMVVADYFAVSLLLTHHHVAGDKQEAAARALLAGLDLELPETDCFGAPLRAAIAAGRVPLQAVDTAVRRVLRAKLALGLFERPYADEAAGALSFDSAAERELALRAASSSVVLLRNDDGLLPLSRGIRRLAVLGPGADDPWALQGDYHYPAHQRVAFEAAEDEELSATWSGEGDLSLLPRSIGEWQPGPYFTPHVTPLAGIRALLGEGTEVVYAEGCTVGGEEGSDIGAAAELAATAEAAVVVLAGHSGLAPSCTVGEARDATRLGLTGRQEALVQAVAATGVPTVVVVLSGRVHALATVDACAGALLQAWPLGEEGGNALAQVLFGEVSPAGRLPVSLPRAVGQVPVHLGQRAGGSTAMFYGEYTDSPTTPLYPFGHGLGYSRFEYGELEVESADTRSPLVATVEVENAGEVAAEEVVQLYVRDLVASVSRPELQLAGFVRLELEPGERRRVRFEISAGRLAFFDEGLRRVVEPGEFRFQVGGSSAEVRSQATVALTGEVAEHPLAELAPTRVVLESPAAEEI